MTHFKVHDSVAFITILVLFDHPLLFQNLSIIFRKTPHTYLSIHSLSSLFPVNGKVNINLPFASVDLPILFYMNLEQIINK